MSESTVYGWPKAKLFPDICFVSEPLWDRVELEAWLEKKRKIEDL